MLRPEAIAQIDRMAGITMRVSSQNTLLVEETSSQSIASQGRFFNDKFENRQWYLDDSNLSQLSIDVNSIWGEYDGTGVTVAVLDSQIDFRHHELNKAYDTSLDYNYEQGTADVTIDANNLPHYHGTFVAGVISAEANNELGTVGIAAGATLVGLGIDYSSSNVVDHIVEALTDAAAFDVVNNSWRFIKAFDDTFSKNSRYEDALIHGVSEGRDGLGTNYVFAAGNTGVTGTANYNSFQNSPMTIAVGSVDADGNPSSFSSIGANVLISAAGRDVFSTDLDGRFDTESGTSFAAPAVSATIALMLQANPDLGYRDVQEILAYSARRDGLTRRGRLWRWLAYTTALIITTAADCISAIRLVTAFLMCMMQCDWPKAGPSRRLTTI